jgi:hypothetical protein
VAKSLELFQWTSFLFSLGKGSSEENRSARQTAVEQTTLDRRLSDTFPKQ